jgi:class 3 adenylate cyclase
VGRANVLAGLRKQLVVVLSLHDVAAVACDPFCHRVSSPGRRVNFAPVAGNETRIQLCGRILIKISGRRVEEDLRGRRALVLFAYLTLNRHRTIARKELLEAVWGEKPLADPRALSTLVAKVRRAVGADVLGNGSEPRVVLPSDAVVDVEAAIDGIHRAEAAVAAEEWQEAYGGARLALYVTERNFLADVDLPWVRRWRQDLEEIQIRALECSVASSLGCGGPELAVAEKLGRRLVERAPYRESAYVLLMETLAARGNAAEALRVYDQAYRVLHDEFGTQPGRALQELRSRLKTEAAATAEPSESRFVPVARTFMFTDIVGSTQLVAALGDEAWDDLLSWHDRALRSIFADHGGEEVDHAGDGFFVSFRSAGSAVECAIAIQRRLVEHRRTHGFAPQVRIGLHGATASRKGSDYRGKGVHEAARIGALAGGSEIVASRATAEAARCRVPFSEPRLVELKGVGEPVEVVSLEWREAPGS